MNMETVNPKPWKAMPPRSICWAYSGGWLGAIMALRGPKTKNEYIGKIQAGIADDTGSFSIMNMVAYCETATMIATATYVQKHTLKAVINHGPQDGTA